MSRVVLRKGRIGRGRALAAVAASTLLAGCLVGPDYKGPPKVAQAAFERPTFHRAEAVSPAAPVGRWWTALGDPELDRLEQAALQASPDLEAAAARVRQARAALSGSRANLLPKTQASALYAHTKGLTNFLGVAPPGATSGAGAAVVASRGLNLYNMGFDATWELDLFGGARRGVEGAEAQEQASQANYEGAKVTLTAEVAQAYVALRDLQHQLELGRENAALEARMVDFATQRRAGGTASDLDVERLTTQLEATRASLVPLQAQITDQLDRLAVLTGREPGALDAELAAASPAPSPPQTVEVGDPAQFLRRRPDIRVAERRLAQENAAIGQRVADLFPKVSLFGQVGFGSTSLQHLLDTSNFTYLTAPSLQWSPFNFGRTQAQIRQAKAGRDEAVANYRKAVLGALQDAEGSLSRYARQRDAVISLARVSASANRAARLTGLRVEGGTASTMDELDAERQRVDAENRLAQAQAQLTQDYIAIQKSLGLGWEADGAS